MCWSIILHRNGNHTRRCTLSIGARRWASSYFGIFKTIFTGVDKGLYAIPPLPLFICLFTFINRTYIRFHFQNWFSNIFSFLERKWSYLIFMLFLEFPLNVFIYFLSKCLNKIDINRTKKNWISLCIHWIGCAHGIPPHSCKPVVVWAFVVIIFHRSNCVRWHKSILCKIVTDSILLFGCYANKFACEWVTGSGDYCADASTAFRCDSSCLLVQPFFPLYYYFQFVPETLAFDTLSLDRC